jgi:methionine-rich copper-binding protein CopC
MDDRRGARTGGTRRSARRWLGIPASLGASVLLALGAAVPASAHDALESATPAADSKVTETLSGVALGFSEDLLALAGDTNGFAIQVTDSDDRHYESGCVSVNGPSASTEVASGPAGTYEVVWQVVSSDGHPTSGSYTFTYAPSQPGKQSALSTAPQCGDAWAGTATAEPSASESTSPTETAESPTPDASSDTPAASDGSDADAASSTVPLWAFVLGGIAVLGLIAAVIVLTQRRSRRLPGEPGEPDAAEPGPGPGDTGRTP